MIGNKQPPPPPMEEHDLLKENLARMEFVGGSRLWPMVYLVDKVKEELSLPWKDSLIVKLLGKKLGFVTLREQLRITWAFGRTI